MEKTIKGFIEALSKEEYKTVLPTKPDINLFFIYNSVRETNLFQYLFGKELDQCQTLIELVSVVNELDYKKKQYNILRFFDIYNNFKDEFYNDILYNIGLTISYINSIAPIFSLQTEDIYTLLGLLIAPKDTVKRLTAYLKEMYPIFITEYDKIESLTSKSNKQIANAFCSLSAFNSLLNTQVIELLHDKPCNIQYLKQVLKKTDDDIKSVLDILNKFNLIAKLENDCYTLNRPRFIELANTLKKYINEI